MNSATLADHKPKHLGVRYDGAILEDDLVCATCSDSDYPCSPAESLGVPPFLPNDYRACLAAWWEASGLTREAAEAAAALEVMR